MFNGYLSLGGRELANAARTEAYVRKNAPTIPLRNCVDCGDLALALGDGEYESPIVDDAPWFDPNRLETGRFYGLYPLAIEGVEDSTRTAAVTESVVDGGSVGQVRFGTRSIRVRGLMLAADELAMSSGMTWLRSALNPAQCLAHGGSCGGAQLCYYAACPEVCDVYDPRYAAGSSFPIYRTTPADSPSIDRNEIYLRTIWKSRLDLDRNEGTIIEWGAINEDLITFAEKNGPVVLRRINYVRVPSFRGTLEQMDLDFWDNAGGVLTLVNPGELDSYLRIVGGLPGEALAFNWAGTPDDSVSEARLIVDNTLAFTNRMENPDVATGSAIAVTTNEMPNPSVESAVTGTAEIRRNYFADPNCTSTATNWSPSLLTASIVNDFPGAATAYRATRSGAGTARIGLLCNSAMVYATRQISVRMRVRSSEALTTVQIEARPTMSTSSGANVLATIDIPAGLSEIAVSGNTPLAALTIPTTGGIAITWSSGTVGGTLDVSDVLIEFSSVPRPFFTGDTPDTLGVAYVWLGTANNSLSVARAALNATPTRVNGCTRPSGATTPFGVISFGDGAGTTSLTAGVGNQDTYAARATWTTAATVTNPVMIYIGGSPTTNSIPVTPGELLSASVWVRVSNTLSMPARIEFYDAANTFISGASGSSTSVSATGGGALRSVTSTLVPAGATHAIIGVYPSIASSWLAGRWIEVSAPIVERGAIVGLYFDGRTHTINDFVYAWTGTPDDSTSGQFGVAPLSFTESTGVACIQSYQWAEQGLYSLRIMPLSAATTSAQSANGAVLSGVTLNPGTSYRVTARFRLSSTMVGGTDPHSRRIWDPASGAQSNQGGVSAGESAITMSFTAVAGSQLHFANGGTGTSLENAAVWWDQILVAEEPSDGVYFDGDTVSGDPFLSYEWDGVPHASSSSLFGLQAKGIYADGGISIRGANASVTWAFGAAARIHPTGPSNETYLTLGAPGTMPMGMVAGGQYTALAEIQLQQAEQTGSLNALARSIVVIANPGGVSQVIATSTQAPNDWFDGYDLRVDFTLSPDVTEVEVRVYNGASAGGGDVTVSHLGLIATEVSGTYPWSGAWFDGNSPDSFGVLLFSQPMVTYNGPVVASFDLRSPSSFVPYSITARLRATADNSILAEANFLIDGDWTRYSFTSIYGGDCYLEFNTVGEVWVNNILLEAGQTPLPYFDGDVPEDEAMAGYLTNWPSPEYNIFWQGEPYASPSESIWIGEVITGVPNEPENYTNSNDGICDAFPWLNVVQGEVAGLGNVAFRLRIPDFLQVAPYERTLHDVTAVEGPFVISETTLQGGGVMREVDFLLVAGRPAPYGSTLVLLNQQRMIDLDTTPWIDPNCDEPEEAPIIDPDCPPVPAPPRPPSIPNSCVTEETVWQRYWLEIPASEVSSWSETAPQVVITSGTQEIRQVRVRAYPNPFTRDIDTATRINLVRNPQLGTALTDYAATVGLVGGVVNLTRETASPPTGLVAYARSTFTTSPTSPPEYTDIRNENALSNLVTPGNSYTFGALQRASYDGTTTLYVQWLDAGGVTLSTAATAGVPSTVTEGWRWFSFDAGVAPVDSVRARLGIRRSGAGDLPIGEWMDATGFVFEETTPDAGLTFFDGETVDAEGWYYGWLGTVNLSSSLAQRSPVDPCGYCSEFIVSYLPAQTSLTVDSILERAFASVAGGEPVAANHLLYSGDGSPMTWPELSCGMDYLLAIDVPEPLLDDVTVTVTLTTKE